MKKDVNIFLGHILESVETIEEHVHGMRKDDFMDSRMSQDAVIRRLEIIGEAVKNIPTPFRTAHPAVPWSGLAGMRDRLIHTYFSVDLELLWAIIKDELPKLKRQVQGLLKEIAQ